ncbi:nuclear transport factor 2 family protein [Sphingobium sp.]|uniref:nuclear transport factor 2 family protein n=1 Tax=Sphingobium sp. TaxID=1912891 RepID=UPI0028BD96DC|nr:nuclear transport factor 2 family protein [Sphingobium sp.]
MTVPEAASHGKTLVIELMGLLTRGEIEGALTLMADDGLWWIGGKPNLFPLAGNKSKAEMRAILNELIVPMPNGLRMTVKSLIAEDDRIAAEIESYGEAGNGCIYNNDYHFLFTIRDGKFIEIKEYLDTMHVQAVFLNP